MGNSMEYSHKTIFLTRYSIDSSNTSFDLARKDFREYEGTTPKNFCVRNQNKQSLLLTLAQIPADVSNVKNLHSCHYEFLSSVKEQEKKEMEKMLFSALSYSSLSTLYSLPPHRRKTDEQITEIKHSLGIFELGTLKTLPLSTCLRHSLDMSEKNIIRANVMITLATNAALRTETAPFNRKKLEKVVEYVLSMTEDYEGMYHNVQNEFKKAGVALFVLPNIPGSKLNGAVKKLKRKVVVLISDKNRTADTFFFTLLHEVAHIKNNDWGPYFEYDEGDAEKKANRYAENMLIPPEKYRTFFASRAYDRKSILSFASEIKRDPGIVVARLQKDGVVRYDDRSLNALKHSYRVEQDTSICLRPFGTSTSPALKKAFSESNS